MGYDDSEEKRDRHARWSDRFKSMRWMLTGGAAVAVLFTVTGFWQGGDRLFTKFGTVLSQVFNPAQPPPKVDVQSIVMQQIRDASELTTASFTMQAVVPTSRDATVGGFVVGTTKLLYIAYGEVQAGVDLSQLKPENVQVVGDTIRLQLPPPRVLNSKIDVKRSNVYDYNRGMLGLGPDVAPELQSLAQQEALKQIVASACTNGLLQKASDRAKLVVTQLLNTAGYKTVTVETQVSKTQVCL